MRPQIELKYVFVYVYVRFTLCNHYVSVFVLGSVRDLSGSESFFFIPI